MLELFTTGFGYAIDLVIGLLYIIMFLLGFGIALLIVFLAIAGIISLGIYLTSGENVFESMKGNEEEREIRKQFRTNFHRKIIRKE